MKCQAFINNQCLSCDYLGFEYDYSKTAKIQELKKCFPSLKDDKFLGFLKNISPSGSRKKVKLAVGQNQTGEIEFGIYDSHQRFIKLEDCPLHDQKINDWLKKFKEILKNYQIMPYDLKTQKGEFKYIIINLNHLDELMVRVVFRSKESLDRIKKLVLNLDSDVKVFSFNIQPEHKAVLEGKEEIVLTAETHLMYELNSLKVFLGVRSFFQVNTEIAINLYQAVADFLAEKKITSMLDLYCGVGAFSLFSASFVEKITGVEISQDAIDSAKMSMKANQISNIDFMVLDVEKYLNNLTENFQVILCNPPRRGLGEKLTKTIVDLRPKYIIYSSCNVQTLAFDSNILLKEYEIESARIFDMFPYSKHFETLMIFKKIK